MINRSTSRKERERFHWSFYVYAPCASLAVFVFVGWVFLRLSTFDVDGFWNPIFALVGFWAALVSLLYTRAQTFSDGSNRRLAVQSAERAMEALVLLGVACALSWCYITANQRGIHPLSIAPGEFRSHWLSWSGLVPIAFFFSFGIRAMVAIIHLAESLSLIKTILDSPPLSAPSPPSPVDPLER